MLQIQFSFVEIEQQPEKYKPILVLRNFLTGKFDLKKNKTQISF